MSGAIGAIALVVWLAPGQYFLPRSARQ